MVMENISVTMDPNIQEITRMVIQQDMANIFIKIGLGILDNFSMVKEMGMAIISIVILVISIQVGLVMIDIKDKDK